MRQPGEKGLTVVELLVSFTIMGIIAVVATPLFSTCLDTYRVANARSMLYHEGLLAMERMTGGVRRSACLLIPNNHNTTRDILAFSGFVNDDNDYYFGDPLFPRIDEDVSADMNDDTAPGIAGIAGIDDDGDGDVDEGSGFDDDEDGFINEDPIDGIDDVDEEDGNIDEDCGPDANLDGYPGIADMDDDGDGDVDEDVAGGGPKWADDDEDGLIDEDPLNPLIYSFDSGTLRERFPYTGESVDLSTHVTFFQVTYEAPERILIELTLTGDDGETVMFSEYVYPRNTLQKTGKRVR